MKRKKLKTKKCPICGERIAEMYKNGIKIIIEGSFSKDFAYAEHTCFIEIPNQKL